MVAEGGASYLMQVRPYRDLNNVIDGAVVTFVDISERKKHEQARALLAAIVEGSQDAIVSHDLEGIITSWNSGAEQLYGYSAAEAIGQSMTMLLAKALPEDWPDVLARLEQGERIAQFDSARTGKDGRPVEVSVTISPVRESDGRIVGASLVARDISRAQGGRAEGGAAARRARPPGQEHPGDRVRRGLADAEDQPHPRSVRRRGRRPHQGHRQCAQSADPGRPGRDVAARHFRDGAGALRSRRRQYCHHWPRRRADAQGRIGLGDGGPRARQQRGQIWCALDDLRSPVDHVAGHRQRSATRL